MSVADLEHKLRSLKMADPEPGIAGRALETLRLNRHLKVAWGAAAAALVLAVGVGMSGNPAPVAAPAVQVLEVEGVRRVVQARPSPRAIQLAFAERKSLEARLIQGSLR